MHSHRGATFPTSLDWPQSTCKSPPPMCLCWSSDPTLVCSQPQRIQIFSPYIKNSSGIPRSSQTPFLLAIWHMSYVICHMSYGGFLSHGGTPSYHPFLDGIFHYKPSIFGHPHSRKPPCLLHKFLKNLHRSSHSMPFISLKGKSILSMNISTTGARTERSGLTILLMGTSCVPVA